MPNVAAPARTRNSCLLIVELVQAHARMRRVQLQIKGRGLDCFLLVTGQACQAVGEGVGYAEVHCGF
jgi:hypothetical protein